MVLKFLVTALTIAVKHAVEERIILNVKRKDVPSIITAAIALMDI